MLYYVSLCVGVHVYTECYIWSVIMNTLFMIVTCDSNFIAFMNLKVASHRMQTIITDLYMSDL